MWVISSEVTTHENWARLHVARRVRDIAKSMIRLSRLGRSIFPMETATRARNCWLILRFRKNGEGPFRPPSQSLSRCDRDAFTDGEGRSRGRCTTDLGGESRSVSPDAPPSHVANSRPQPGPGRRRHGGRAGTGDVGGPDVAVGPDPWPSPI